MRSILALLFLLLVGAGCELLPDGDEPQVFPEARPAQFEGFYAQGFEDSTFQPCGRDDRWWVTGDEEALRTLAQGYTDAGPQSNYAPVFARVRGTLSPSGTYGNFDFFARALAIDEVLEVRAARPGDCR